MINSWEMSETFLFYPIEISVILVVNIPVDSLSIILNVKFVCGVWHNNYPVFNRIGLILYLWIKNMLIIKHP